ncbi:hypothetical protein [Streptomyces sp. MZ04]|uniref:hypothetical protein n=1 Tax=Streptomyces sp. MZ04 TaxID=2559236 RepID=UPI00107E7E18|nr:hypothetical protein [Streptomyces sp. MZ04]TGB15158.1 hypothetical protein E2651_03825 [Streptomyces sp. MZ04]
MTPSSWASPRSGPPWPDTADLVRAADDDVRSHGSWYGQEFRVWHGTDDGPPAHVLGPQATAEAHDRAVDARLSVPSARLVPHRICEGNRRDHH